MIIFQSVSIGGCYLVLVAAIILVFILAASQFGLFGAIIATIGVYFLYRLLVFVLARRERNRQ